MTRTNPRPDPAQAGKQPQDTSQPTLDEWVGASVRTHVLLRRAFDRPGSVKRGELLAALETFERLDLEAM